METDNPKKTGLGHSFLLQRTEPLQPSQTPERSEAPAIPDASNAPEASNVPAVPDIQPSQASGRPRRSRRPKSAKTIRKIPRDKCTLHIDRDVNERLELVAGIEGRERSEVVTQILRKHLPNYRVERE